jgi:hypothetical protein
VSSRIFRRRLGYAKLASFFPLRLDQVFRCGALGVSPVVECGWPFFGLMRKAISQASEDRASVRYCSTASHPRHNGIRRSVSD